MFTPITEADERLPGLSGRFRLDSNRIAEVHFLDDSSPLTVLHEFAHL